MKTVQRTKEEKSVKVACSLEAKIDLIHHLGRGGCLNELDSPDYTSFDSETGEASLRHLEDKVQAFLTDGTTQVKPFLVELKRFDIEVSFCVDYYYSLHYTIINTSFLLYYANCHTKMGDTGLREAI